jgi:hypothetical protein
MQTQGHITFLYHKPLNTTLKLNNTNEFREVSVKKNKQPKGYLADTASSINKKKIKYVETIQPPQTRRMSSCSQKQERQSISIYKTFCRLDSSENHQYHDKLNHFSENSDFGNDPFGHFS